MAIGVILAGGKGVRFGDERPKQFHFLAGKPIIAYSLETFLAHPEIDHVAITYPDGFLDEVKRITAALKSDKPITFIEGGDTRGATTLAALKSVEPEKPKKILFHDGVRPFVTADIITRSIAALDEYDAVDVVVDTADTIVQLENDIRTLHHIPARYRLRRGQTPQGFWTNQLYSAYQKIDEADLPKFTDDCGVLLDRMPMARIAAVQGSDTNIKITTPMDLYVAEQILFSGHGNASPKVSARTNKSPIAVLIGAASGLGSATADHIRGMGWNVHVTSRSMGVDVCNIEQVSNYLSEVNRASGPIDIVANFAGVLHVGSLTEMSPEALDETFTTNLIGTVNVAQTAHRYLKDTRGQLILTASSSYYRGRKGTAAYSASKAAVVNLTQALADEWADDDIAVSCIVPRRADTPMRRKAFPNEDPAGNLRPEAVAKAFVDLCEKRVSGMIRHVY